MEHEQLVSSPAPRDKLGLSLAGGGFRASLFHLGVLRRLAELDVLRRVEVLSTVSGGSIIGALYVLLLKKRLEADPDGDLSRDGYVGIVDELGDALVAGIRRNLRNRLFTNPLGVLRMLLTPQSLGERMARLYERHLFRDVVEEIASPSAADRMLRPGHLPLQELRIRPAGERMERGIEDHNRRAVEDGRSVSTKLVVNATSLNSGARFWFSSSEVGDWRLGHVRHSEIDTLLDRKELHRAHRHELEERLHRDDAGSGVPARAIALALWWRSKELEDAPPGGYWDPLFGDAAFPGELPHAEQGLLRQAKNPAWYLAEGLSRDPAVAGGRAEETHWSILWETLARIDADLAGSLRRRVEADPGLEGQLLDFLMELYWLRSAEIVSGRIGRFWRTISVGDAVAASAGFPPVFPPFKVLGLYDDLHVSRLGLTDGGVFDNMGLTALVEEGCTQIVASDTSGLFRDLQRVSTGRLTMMSRIVSVLMNVVAGGQREALRERRRVSRALEEHVGPGGVRASFLAPRSLRGLAYFHMDSSPVDPPGPSPRHPAPTEAFDEETRHALASLRTDLDAFGELEVAGLVDHGYGTADRYVRRYFSEEEMTSPGEGMGARPFWNEHWARPPERPMEIRVAREELLRSLEAGRSRFFRALRLYAPLSWAFTLAVAVSVVWWTWGLRVSVAEGPERLAGAVVSALRAMAPWLGGGWTTETVPVGLLLAVAGLAVVLPGAMGFDLVRWARDRGMASFARRLSTLAKWARSLSGNLLWALGAFPIVLALGTSLLALANEVFFTRPYLRATRNRQGVRIRGPAPRQRSA